MSMAQNWAIIGALIGTLATLITVTYRSMSLHGRAMTDAMTSAVDGLRHEVHAGLNGLRNEMTARFESVDHRFDSVEDKLSRLATLDREVHALTLKVFGGKPPDSS